MPPNYFNGKIYKITNADSSLVYYGSTTQLTLAKRLTNHVACYRYYKSGGNRSFISVFKIIETGDYHIVLVENFPCNTKDELEARERYWIENNDCVNKTVPTRSMSEYRDVNKHDINEKRRQKRLENIDESRLNDREYYLKNKEAKTARARAYYQENSEKYLKKVRCECGCDIGLKYLKKHKQTPKHLKFLN